VLLRFQDPFLYVYDSFESNSLLLFLRIENGVSFALKCFNPTSYVFEESCFKSFKLVGV